MGLASSWLLSGYFAETLIYCAMPNFHTMNPFPHKPSQFLQLNTQHHWVYQEIPSKSLSRDSQKYCFRESRNLQTIPFCQPHIGTLDFVCTQPTLIGECMPGCYPWAALVVNQSECIMGKKRPLLTETYGIQNGWLETGITEVHCQFHKDQWIWEPAYRITPGVEEPVKTTTLFCPCGMKEHNADWTVTSTKQ